MVDEHQQIPGDIDNIEMCIDVDEPERLLDQDSVDILRPDAPDESWAISLKGVEWPNGSTLRVRFLDGDDTLHQRVLGWANEWCSYANMLFKKVTSGESDIRVSFKKDGTSWSIVGKGAKSVPQDKATMNLGFESIERGTVLHEFGHALGLSHEHQNPEGGMQWNEPAVLRYFGGPPNNWPPQKTTHNVIKRYSKDQIRGTRFDSHSIMLYAYPASLTLDGRGTKQNNELSATDKAYIRWLYPGRPAKSAVTLYKDANFKGKSVELEVGHYDVGEFGIDNDTLSSLWVRDGYTVTIFEHAGFKGRSKSFSGEQKIEFVGQEFNDIASSIVVERRR